MDRDAYLAIGYDSGFDGTLFLEEPRAEYQVYGDCNQEFSEHAEFWFQLNGGVPYRGTIYVAADGQIYMEGEQDGSGIRFTLRRQ